MDVRKRWTPADWGMPPGSLMAEAWWQVLMMAILLALIAAGNPSRDQIEAKARRISKISASEKPAANLH